MRVLSCLAVLLAVACGSETAAPGQPLSVHAGLRVMAPFPARPSEGRLWIPFYRGADGAFPGRPVAGRETVTEADFDPLVFRIAGEQWYLSPSRSDPSGAWGIDLDLRQWTGDAMLGFSTRAREFDRRHDEAKQGDGKRVRVKRHVKYLFHVRGPGSEHPEASAALSARFGFDFELVPLIDPLPLGIGDELPVRLRFPGPESEDGELARARIAAGYYLPGTGLVPVSVEKPDSSGIVVIAIIASGIWVVSASHERELEDGVIERHEAELVFRTREKR